MLSVHVLPHKCMRKLLLSTVCTSWTLWALCYQSELCFKPTVGKLSHAVALHDIS
jgi:hypothetical protein